MKLKNKIQNKSKINQKNIKKNKCKLGKKGTILTFWLLFSKQCHLVNK